MKKIIVIALVLLSLSSAAFAAGGSEGSGGCNSKSTAIHVEQGGHETT